MRHGLCLTEFDNRLFLKPITQNQYVIRAQGRYKINETFETGTGFTYLSVATQDPEATTDFNTPEYRGQQDITWKQNLGKITLNQRFQLEERFIHNANKTALLPGTTFSWRFRYRMQGDYTFWKAENRFLKAIVSDEILINAGKSIIKNTFDQNRVYTALQYGVNKNHCLRAGLFKQFSTKSQWN